MGKKDLYLAEANIYKNGVKLSTAYFKLDEDMGSEIANGYIEVRPKDFQKFDYYLRASRSTMPLNQPKGGKL